MDNIDKKLNVYYVRKEGAASKYKEEVFWCNLKWGDGRTASFAHVLPLNERKKTKNGDSTRMQIDPDNYYIIPGFYFAVKEVLWGMWQRTETPEEGEKWIDKISEEIDRHTDTQTENIELCETHYNRFDDLEQMDENTTKTEQETVKVECPECGNAQNLPSYMAHGTRICCGCEKEFTTSFADNLETFDHSTVPK